MYYATQLNFAEKVTLDPDRLVELCVSMGTGGAEGLVAQSMEELAIGLGDIENAYLGQEWDHVSKLTTGLMDIANNIGMTTFARVLGDVGECAEAGQPVALAATLDRLRRIADKSLNAVWDMQDVPG